MRSSTFWALVALVGLALPIATACGGGSSDTSKTSPPPSQMDQQPQQAAIDSSWSKPPTGIPPGGGQLVTLPSGLQYEDLKVGTGNFPMPQHGATVNYTGWLTNGKKFDSSFDHGQPFTFSLGAGEVIKGWDEGVATMHIGGKRKLIVPPDLAYGSNSPSPDIPPNSTLVFEVDLLDSR